jgi:DNA-binding SARP family transcriptional activator/tetratricopeptide (TPR) repeat protein
MLAALAVDAGRPVTVETLIDRVWDDRPPERVRRALHAHVTRIRRMLEQAVTAGEQPARLLRRAGGYLLDIDPHGVDLHRFRRLVDRARGAQGDPERVVLLREAIQLWRGEPLAGLGGRWAARTRQAWRQQYLDAVLAWASAELGVGNSAAVIGPLTDLVGEHPFLEPLIALLMRALYAMGRSADALDMYTATRERLVRELGTEPGSELRKVQQGILRDDLDKHEGPRVKNPRPIRATPAQLPRDVRGFTGRRSELAQLDAIVPSAVEQGTPVVIGALAGTAGVGKTALAVHWAHRVRGRFPDGQLYVNLRGFDPGGSVMDPADAVRAFLDALQVPPKRIPTSLDAQAALYRRQLVGRRMLVVLDNAHDTTQVRPLLPDAEGCLALVTSRNQLTGLVATDGAYPITLDLLSTAEARELLASRLGANRVAAEREAVEEIITRCVRLPLALTIVAARAATHPHLPLSTLAAELRDAGGRLEALSTDDPHSDVRAVFSWSYRALTPDAATLMRLLGLHPGPDIAPPAAASLAALPLPTARALLAGLARANLVVEHTPGRYTFHDLLRAYATDLTHTIDSDQQRRAAIRRMLDYYLHTAYAADRLLNPQRDPLTQPLAPPASGVILEQPTGHRQAMAWLATEHRVLLGVVRQAAEAGFDTYTGQLAWTLNTFLNRQGHWQDLSAVWRTALDASRRLADPLAQARAHRTLARTYTWLGRHPDAHTHLRHAMDLYAQADDHVGQAHTHRGFSSLWERQRRPDRALHHMQQALTLHQTAGHRRGQGLALIAIGWYHALLGNPEQALSCSQEALALHQQLDDRAGEAASVHSLGYAHHLLGDHQQAADRYQRALHLYRSLGDRYYEADVLTRLGDTHHAAGNPQAARDAWKHALAILDDLDHPDADNVRAKLDTSTSDNPG